MTPERTIARLLARRELTLATAESCTGGLIAHRITNVPGSSNYFERGFVTYSNRSKIESLGVESSLIENCGAVSSEVVRAMAVGAAEVSAADVSLAVSGIAGPISDQSNKPVGLVYIAVRPVDGPVIVEKHEFKGNRLQIKKQSADAALSLLIRTLNS